MPLSERDILEALSLRSPGARSDYDLNPGARRAGVSRPAAVLCPIVPRREGLQVVLTRRAAHMRAHAGQIAFPGGKVEPGDPSPLATALREAREEIGLDADSVEVLGTLEPYVTVTGFRVTPFVAIIAPAWRPLPDPEEVEAVFEVPLDFLMDPANLVRGSYDRGGRRRSYYAIPWGEHNVWGATAGMLKALSDRLATVRGEKS